MTALNCKRFQETWDDFKVGHLKKGDQDELNEHYESCPICREYAQTLEAIGLAVGNSQMDPLLQRRLAVAAADMRQVRRTPQLHFVWKAAAGLAVAAMAALVFSLGFQNSSTPGKPPGGQIAKDVSPRAPVVSPNVPKASFASNIESRIESMTNGEGGRASIDVMPGTTLWIAPRTTVQTLVLNNDMARFKLVSGKVTADFGPHLPGFRFIVETPKGEVEARGTVFTVEIGEDGQDTTRVLEGSVEVRAFGEQVSHLVTAGQQLTLGDQDPVAAHQVDLRLDQCLVDGCQVETPDEKSTRRGIKKRGVATNSGATGELAVSAIKEKRFDDAERLMKQVIEQNPKGGMTRDLLAQLARAYRRGRLFKPAADTYRRLLVEFPGSEAATNGLVALAQIEMDALGDNGSAINHFEMYLRRAPNHYLSEAARAGKVRAFQKMGNNQQVILGCNKYLKAHPTGLFVAEMIRRRADARVRMGNCGAAIKEYRQIMARWPGSREAQKAASGLGACGETR